MITAIVVDSQTVEAQVGVFGDGTPLTGLIVEYYCMLGLIVECKRDLLKVVG